MQDFFSVMDNQAQRSVTPSTTLNNTSVGTSESPGQSEDNDTEHDYHFAWYNHALLFYSILTYLIDIVLDILLADSLRRNGHMWYFGLTLTFIIVPALIIIFFSLKWYNEDKNKEGAPKFTPFGWVVRIFFHFLLLGPLVRCIDILRYALKHRELENIEGQDSERKRRKYHHYIIYDEADTGYLRLFEGFIEAAPQTLLQLYILVQLDNMDSHTTRIFRIVSIAFSLFSLSSGFATQQRSMRISQKKPAPTCTALFVQFLWFLNTVISRLFSLGLFISLHPRFLALILGARWIVTIILLIPQKTNLFDFGNNTGGRERTCNRENLVSCVADCLYKCALGVVLLFVYMNPLEGQTRWRYTVFYITIFFENAVFISVWYASVDVWYRLPAILVVFLTFFMGIMFMMMYYLIFHPREIKICPRKQRHPQATIEEVPLHPTTDTSANSPNSSGSLNLDENLDQSLTNSARNGRSLSINGTVQMELADVHYETNF